MFMDALDVDDVIAHLLVTEGFTTVEEVAFVPTEELTGDRRLRRGRGERAEDPRRGLAGGARASA